MHNGRGSTDPQVKIISLQTLASKILNRRFLPEIRTKKNINRKGGCHEKSYLFSCKMIKQIWNAK